VKTIYEELLERLDRGDTVAVATIVRTRGSTPREVGAKMIIDEAGRATGTIGGGCGEADVWSRAQDVLETGEPEVVEVDLLSDSDDEGGRACGGIMYVHIERLTGQIPGQ
jgi:xanthine/CO dehydrogenase XdhC/CoxF family maturation factor